MKDRIRYTNGHPRNNIQKMIKYYKLINQNNVSTFNHEGTQLLAMIRWKNI